MRRPEYIAVAHSARSRSSAASSCRASSGDAMRSRRPRTAGSSSPVVGFTATSPRATARRKIARTGSSVLRIVDGSWSASSSRSTNAWSSARWISLSAIAPRSGRTRIRSACSYPRIVLGL